jgi:hypothetical protein
MRSVIKIEALRDGENRLARFYQNFTNSLIPNLGDIVFGKQPVEYFVAEIIGFDPKYKFKREFLRGKRDYSESNSKGSRGVYIWYKLEPNKIYDVKKPISWKNIKRFFCTVKEDGSIVELTEQEVIECLKKYS